MNAKQSVILSGKGGTGKTSLVAVFARIVSEAVLVDCDVDAANLHLLVAPEIEQRRDFVGGAKARIDDTCCTGCGACAEACRFDAVRVNGLAAVNLLRCEGCGVCVRRCPTEAISLEPQICGQWFLSRTASGPMVHAHLDPGQENSGKLVCELRHAAESLACTSGASWILIDGPPGIGCPVISSLTGADYVVLVTEPTLSGFADLQRVAAVADHFRIPSGIIINKADINLDVADDIEEFAAASCRDLLGRIQYDPVFTKAQMFGSSVLDVAPSELRRRLEGVWRAVERAVRKEDSCLTLLQ